MLRIKGEKNPSYSCFIKIYTVFLAKGKFCLFTLGEDSGIYKEKVFSSVLQNQISVRNQRLLLCC